MKNNELNTTKKYLQKIDLNDKSQIINLLSNVFPILIEDKKSLLIEAIQRWFLNWNDLDVLWRYLEEVLTEDKEIQGNKNRYYEYVWWTPEPYFPNVKDEIDKFKNLMKMIFFDF